LTEKKVVLQKPNTDASVIDEVAIVCGDKILDLSSPVVMGVLNVTPDSFSDGGRFLYS
jgi:hypothetical protein